jgi:ABC-type transport system substrate-binding protein
MAYTLSSLTIDPYNYLKSYYHPSGAQRQGTDDTFRDLIDKAGKEFDDKKRQAILHDVQRHEAETMFFPRIGAATGLQIFWPALRNVNVWQGGSGRPNATLFLDPTKAPLKRA